MTKSFLKISTRAGHDFLMCNRINLILKGGNWLEFILRSKKKGWQKRGTYAPQIWKNRRRINTCPPIRFSDLAPSLNEKMSHMNLYKAIKVTSLEQLSLDEFSGKKISKRSKHFWEECTLIYADVTLLKDGSEHNFIFSFTIY